MENQKEEKTTATEIKYLHGDATAPVGDGTKIIVHVCNNIGAWGAGFVLALSKKWKAPELAYRSHGKYDLGDYELVPVEGKSPTNQTIVCNLIGQEGTVSRLVDKKLPPVRYVAIEHGLKQLARSITASQTMMTDTMSVHMPMIGSGLAGGNWLIIERIIETTLCEAGIPVTVYKFE